MKKKDKVEKIQQLLAAHYPKPGVPLDHKDPYTLLVAVMLSAQTTDKKVNEVTPGLFQLADNPKDMAKQSVADIKEKIKFIGLSNNKAKNLKALSKILDEKHQGIVPQTYEDLEALPGVGHKTASVVMSQAFGHPAFPVDTHIHRLAYRWGLSKEQPHPAASTTQGGTWLLLSTGTTLQPWAQTQGWILMRTPWRITLSVNARGASGTTIRI